MTVGDVVTMVCLNRDPANLFLKVRVEKIDGTKVEVSEVDHPDRRYRTHVSFLKQQEAVR